MNDKQIVDIARIKLPLVVEALTKANLEAQREKPNLNKLEELLRDDAVDGFYDVSDLLNARSTTKRVSAKVKKEAAERADHDES